MSTSPYPKLLFPRQYKHITYYIKINNDCFNNIFLYLFPFYRKIDSITISLIYNTLTILAKQSNFPLIFRLIGHFAGYDMPAVPINTGIAGISTF